MAIDTNFSRFFGRPYVTIDRASSYGEARRLSISIGHSGTSRIWLGEDGDAREIAHAMLEAIGDPVPGAAADPEHGKFLAVTGPIGAMRASGRIVDATGPREHLGIAVSDFSRRQDEEYHVFRHVATVDAKPEPAPQPERTIVKVGGCTADPARSAQVGA